MMTEISEPDTRQHRAANINILTKQTAGFYFYNASILSPAHKPKWQDTGGKKMETGGRIRVCLL